MPKVSYKQRWEYIRCGSFQRLFTEYRKANFLTKLALGEKLGLKAPAISFYENGATSKITVDFITKLNNAMYFDVFQGLDLLGYYTYSLELSGIFLALELTYESKEIDKLTLRNLLTKEGYSVSVPHYPEKPFGKLVKEKRLERQLTQQQLATYLRTNSVEISRIEKGVDVRIDPVRFSQLINFFHMDALESLYCISDSQLFLDSIELCSLIPTARTLTLGGKNISPSLFRKLIKKSFIKI